jgi:hypothetical protein
MGEKERRGGEGGGGEKKRTGTNITNQRESEPFTDVILSRLNV